MYQNIAKFLTHHSWWLNAFYLRNQLYKCWIFFVLPWTRADRKYVTVWPTKQAKNYLQPVLEICKQIIQSYSATRALKREKERERVMAKWLYERERVGEGELWWNSCMREIERVIVKWLYERERERESWWNSFMRERERERESCSEMAVCERESCGEIAVWERERES